MDEKSYLVEKITAIRRKKNIAMLLQAILVGLAVSGVPAAVMEFLSIFFPFYGVHFAAAVCFGTGAVAGTVFTVIKRTGMKTAARYMDSFGLGERILTAYENLDSRKEIYALQRTDAVTHLKEHMADMKVPICPPGRCFAAAAISLCMVLIFAAVPSQAKDTAKERHGVMLEAKEKEKEIEKELNQLEKADTSSLTEEQKQALKELQESLKLSMESMQNVRTKEALAEENQKLAYKYEAAAELLAENMAGDTPDSAGSENGNHPSSGDRNETESAGNAGNQNTGSSGSDGQQSGNNRGDNGNSQKGDGSGNGDGSGESGNGDGSGESGNGDGNGNGTGTGSGSGNGGNGSGNGSGRGTGSSDAVHDYVSIPNQVGIDKNIAGKKGDSRDSDYYRAKNGLAWQGEHVSVDSVIGDYTKDAYEGIASGKYPSGMESVIRDYFESLN